VRVSLCVWEKLLCVVQNVNDLSKLPGPTVVTLFGPWKSPERQKTKSILWSRFWNARTPSSGMTSNASIQRGSDDASSLPRNQA